MTELRAVTALHLSFMADYDMASSFTLSLVNDDKLVGLFMGGHRIERRLPCDLRDEFEVLPNQVSLQLSAMRDIEQLAGRNDRFALRAALADRVERSGGLVDALLHQHVTLLDLIPDDGAAIRYGGRVDVVGRTPDGVALTQLHERLIAAGLSAELSADSVPAAHPALAAELEGVAGILVQPLNTGGDYIAWIRSEQEGVCNVFGGSSMVRAPEPKPMAFWYVWSIVGDLARSVF